MPRARWLIAPTLTMLVSALALAAVSTLRIDWAAWRPATCLPDACFCEALGSGTIVQPSNTWSNLAFVWVGIFIAVSATPDRPLRRLDALILAVACVAIGLGSWFYHASLTFVGQWFDVMSMYLLGTFMVLHAAARLKPIGDRTFTVYYLAINLALGALLIVWPDARRYVFGGLIVIALILEAISHRRKQTRLQAKWLIAALGVYVIAQVIWTLDLNHLVCDPMSVLQGHAVWHVLTAASAGLLYVYYQSEMTERRRLIVDGK